MTAYQEQENLMRGKLIRQMAFQQMMEFDKSSKYMAYAGTLVAVYLAFVVDTQASHYGAIAALVSSGAILINGGILLHRKWNELVAMEEESEKPTDALKNPSIEVSLLNKVGVGISGTIAYGFIALAVITYSYSRFPNLFW